MNLEFSPELPLSVLIIFVLLSLALLMALLILRPRGWWLRSLTLILLSLCLLNPQFTWQERQPLSNIAVVVVDHSKSQSLANRLAQTDKALAQIQEMAKKLPNIELRVVTVSNDPSRDEGTRLFAALDQALGDIPAERYAGALFITDGEVHDVPDVKNPAALASLPKAPLQVLLSGSRHERDRRLVIDQAPRFGLVDGEVSLTFHVEDQGGGSEPVSVTVKRDMESLAPLLVKPGEPATLTLKLPHAGRTIVELSVPEVANEITTENNHGIAIIEGIRDKLRVLLISGEPYVGERTWRNMLKSDAAVELVHFTILRPPDRFDPTPSNELALISFPTRELFVEKVSEFDLVIFDRYHRESVLPDAYVQFVTDYVRNGGALLVASGPEFAESDGLYSSPLSDVLPASPTGEVREGEFRPALTETGVRHPVTADLTGASQTNPSWGPWFRTVASNADPAKTLLSGQEQLPLLVLSHQGKGRVAQLLSDQSWLWGRDYQGGGPQNELLRRLTHWLMKEPDLEEEALRGKQEGNKLMVERQTLAEKAGAVTVTDPQGQKTMVTLNETRPGRWVGELPVEHTGIYQLDDGKMQSVAAVTTTDAREMRDLMATADKLAPVVVASGGSLSWLEEGMPALMTRPKGRSMAGPGWIAFQENGAFRLLGLKGYPLAVSLILLIALLLAALATWLREGR